MINRVSDLFNSRQDRSRRKQGRCVNLVLSNFLEHIISVGVFVCFNSHERYWKRHNISILHNISKIMIKSDRDNAILDSSSVEQLNITISVVTLLVLSV